MGKVDGSRAEQAAQAIRERFSFGFVCVSVVPDVINPILRWDYAAGGSNERYELIHLPNGVGAWGKVFALGRGIVVDSVDADIPENELFQYPIVTTEALKSFFCFPLMEGGRIAVIVLCGQRFMHTIDDAQCSTVQRFAAAEFDLETCGAVPVRIHGKQEGFAYGELSRNLLLAQEAERKRIAQELHDGISQEVLVAQMELRRLSYLPQDEWPTAVSKASALLRDVMTHISAMAKSLRPVALDELGLACALESLCAATAEGFGLRVPTDIDECPPLENGHDIAVYRVAQEALANACKYSGADEVRVSLKWDDGTLRLSVADDGCGFNTENVEVKGTGLGLEGMRERAALVGGTLVVRSAPGEGTAVSLEVETGK